MCDEKLENELQEIFKEEYIEDKSYLYGLDPEDTEYYFCETLSIEDIREDIMNDVLDVFIDYTVEEETEKKKEKIQKLKKRKIQQHRKKQTRVVQQQKECAEKIILKWKDNSCYMDAVLFVLLMVFPRAFEHITTTEIIQEKERIRKTNIMREIEEEKKEEEKRKKEMKLIKEKECKKLRNNLISIYNDIQRQQAKSEREQERIVCIDRLKMETNNFCKPEGWKKGRFYDVETFLPFILSDVLLLDDNLSYEIQEIIIKNLPIIFPITEREENFYYFTEQFDNIIGRLKNIDVRNKERIEEIIKSELGNTVKIEFASHETEDKLMTIEPVVFGENDLRNAIESNWYISLFLPSPDNNIMKLIRYTKFRIEDFLIVNRGGFRREEITEEEQKMKISEFLTINDVIYELKAVLVATTGHWFSVFKKCQNDNWYLFDSKKDRIKSYARTFEELTLLEEINDYQYRYLFYSR